MIRPSAAEAAALEMALEEGHREEDIASEDKATAATRVAPPIARQGKRKRTTEQIRTDSKTVCAAPSGRKPYRYKSPPTWRRPPAASACRTSGSSCKSH